MFQPHVLGHRSLGSIRFIAIFDLAYEFTLDLTCTAPNPFLLLLVGLFLYFLQLLNPLEKLVLLFDCGFELDVEDVIGEMELADLTSVEMDGGL
jgi:hypothetical protein